MIPDKITTQTNFDAEYDKNIWAFENLGIPPLQTTGGRSFNFSTIEPLWLRRAAKQYIRYSLATLRPGSALARLTSLKSFARFLNQYHPQLQPEDIDRALVVEYLGFLSRRKLANGSRAMAIGGLKSFLQLSAQNQWLSLATPALIYQQDFPQQKKLCLATFPQKFWLNSSRI